MWTQSIYIWLSLWCLAYLHGHITMFIRLWDWYYQYLLLFLTQPSSETQKTWMNPGGRQRASTCKCGKEICKVSGTDWTTVLARSPFSVTCLEADWSLCLALLSLRYLDAPALMQKVFMSRVALRSKRDTILCPFIGLFSWDLMAAHLVMSKATNKPGWASTA